MRYLSLFSGIEAATVAWQPMGWECVGVSEIDAFPCAVLAHYYPSVPNLGDVTKLAEQDIADLGQIDVIVFGSPCQDLSLAGKRKGFTDDNGATTRSGLFFTAMRIVEWAKKHCGLRFALWENVPGAFSSNKGADFAEVVGHLAGIDSVEIPPKGWGTEGCAVGKEGMVEWSTLDAQWFGVAQRRRRVFALADFGDWASRPPLLLESESLRGHTPPSREAGKRTAGNAERSTGENSEGGRNAEPGLVLSEVSYVMAHGQGGAEIMRNCSPTLSLNHEAPIIAFDTTQITSRTNRSNPRPGKENPCHTLTAGADAPLVVYSTKLHNTTNNQAGKFYEEYTVALDVGSPPPAVIADTRVRSLSPVECERLQGFPDGYTAIPWRGKQASDSNRYKALGNSMAVPVMHWIGKQLDFMQFF